MVALTYRAAMEMPLLDVEEERAAIRDWQSRGDRAALERLVRAHARQVHAQARRWTSNPVELEDLVAEGMIGLMRAADQFDLSQEVRFSTYARWWVMTSVATALARMKSLVDMPPRTYLDARMGRLSGLERDLALQALNGQVNIDALIRGESGLHSHDLASPEMTPEEHAEAMSSAALLRRVMDEAVDGLGDPDAEVLRRHRLNAAPETIEEIAAAMGLSRDRIRQIERRAMTRLKLSLQRLGYTPAMLH